MKKFLLNNISFVPFIALILASMQSFPINHISRMGFDKDYVAFFYNISVLVFLSVGTYYNYLIRKKENKEKEMLPIKFYVYLVVGLILSLIISDATKTEKKTMIYIENGTSETFYFERDFYEERWRIVRFDKKKIDTNKPIIINF